MRIWSLHPSYLDAKGLVALWRETLLAKRVLEGKTKGYRNHPQLFRFKQSAEPLKCINQYLFCILEEATKRGYRFDEKKIDTNFQKTTLTVTQGQMKFEMDHLLRKLEIRDPQKFNLVKEIKQIEPHPLFTIVKGNIEVWEILKQ